MVFIVVEGRRFARGTHWHNARDPGENLRFDEVRERDFVELLALKRRNQGGESTFKHRGENGRGVIWEAQAPLTFLPVVSWVLELVVRLSVVETECPLLEALRRRGRAKSCSVVELLNP